MAIEGVYMDTEAVGAMASKFKQLGDSLQGVSKALQMAMMILKTTAFVGLIGGLAVERYLAQIQPRIEKLAKKMVELSGDLEGAIRAYRDGDLTGSQRFAN
jgi:hypothetical protein